MPDLRIATSDVDGAPHAVHVSVGGSITSSNLPEFQEAVARLVGPKKSIPIIDLKEAAYISSVGLAYLVELVDRMDRFGGMVILVDVNPKIRALFETLGVDPLFQIAPTREGAVALARTQDDVITRAPKLVEVSGPSPGNEYPIIGNVISIGSDPRCTLVLKHPQIDRRHAEVYIHDHKVFVKDLGTLFGTYVGRERVKDQQLKDGDMVSIGMFRYEFKAPRK